MNNPSSPLDTLRQLKEMLDAGALTPTEFEALKQRLVFSNAAEAPAPPAAQTPPVAPVSPVTPASPSASVPPVPPTPPVAPVADRPIEPVTPAPVAPIPAAPVASQPSTFTELRSSSLGQESSAPAPPVGPASAVPPARPVFTEIPSPPPPVVPPAASTPPPAAFTSPPIAATPPPVAFVPPPAPAPEESGWVADEFPESERPSPRSPLALILSIGGLLALLSLVVYLSLNRPPSERISSTSLTAADSVAAPIETGPQAEQIVLPVETAPETVRVVPSNPAPPLPARLAPAARDTVATPAPAPAPAPADSVGP